MSLETYIEGLGLTFIKYALLKEQYSLKYFLFFGSPELGLELHGIVGPKSLLNFCAYVIVYIRNFSIYGRRFPSARQAVGQSMSVKN